PLAGGFCRRFRYVFAAGGNRRLARGGIEQLKRVARDIIDLEGAIGGASGGARHLVNQHRSAVLKMVLTDCGDFDRWGIADVFDWVVFGLPVGVAPTARIHTRDVFHRTIGGLVGPLVFVFQTARAGDGDLKLRRPAGADIAGVVVHGKAVAREAQPDVDEPDE